MTSGAILKAGFNVAEPSSFQSLVPQRSTFLRTDEGAGAQLNTVAADITGIRTSHQSKTPSPLDLYAGVTPREGPPAGPLAGPPRVSRPPTKPLGLKPRVSRRSPTAISHRDEIPRNGLPFPQLRTKLIPKSKNYKLEQLLGGTLRGEK